ncbi:MAG: ribose 5-phosphate isomerase B [Sandaracinaceae bacterium]|nr:ribose 5-phosphate isomerase B [Sandaracinaceae bacterium]
MRIAIGCDHAGLPLKRALLPSLEARATQVRDVGTHDEASCDYPDYAHELARLVAEGEVDLGVLICGSGVGMSIAANRHAGVRAVVCSEPYSAAMVRKHNDANVLCMGARVVGPGLAEGILEAFLSASFEGGRHARRVGKIEPA